jgi:hypothetical protein
MISLLYQSVTNQSTAYKYYVAIKVIMIDYLVRVERWHSQGMIGGNRNFLKQSIRRF